MMNIRIGDIVKTPTGGIFGDRLAIVVEKLPDGVGVHSGGFDLLYEAEALRLWGRITLGRTYGRMGRRRFRVCVYVPLIGSPRELHVCVRNDSGEETRALEVRKLAFTELRAVMQ